MEKMKIHTFHKNVYLGGALLVAAIVGLVMFSSSRADNFAQGSTLTFNGTVNSIYGNVDNLAITDDVSAFVIEHSYFTSREIRAFFTQPLRAISGTISNSILNTRSIEISQLGLPTTTINPNSINIDILKGSLGGGPVAAGLAVFGGGELTDSVRYSSNAGNGSYDLSHGPVSFIFSSPISNWGNITLNTPANKVVAYLTDGIAHFDFYANGQLLLAPDNLSLFCNGTIFDTNVLTAFLTNSCLNIRTNFGSSTHAIPAHFEVRGNYYGVGISDVPMAGLVNVHFIATGWDNVVKGFDLSGTATQFDLVPEGSGGGFLSAIDSVKNNLSALVLGCGNPGDTPVFGDRECNTTIGNTWNFPRVMPTLHQATVWFNSEIGSDTTISSYKLRPNTQNIAIHQYDPSACGGTEGSYDTTLNSAANLSVSISSGFGDPTVLNKANKKSNTASAILADNLGGDCAGSVNWSSNVGGNTRPYSQGPVSFSIPGGSTNFSSIALPTPAYKVTANLNNGVASFQFFNNANGLIDTLSKDCSFVNNTTSALLSLREQQFGSCLSISTEFGSVKENIACSNTIVEDNHVTCVYATPLTVNEASTLEVHSHSSYLPANTMQTFILNTVASLFNDQYNVTNLPGLSIFFNERLNTTINSILTINVPRPTNIAGSQTGGQSGSLTATNQVTLQIASHPPECSGNALCPQDTLTAKANTPNMAASALLAIAVPLPGAYPPADCDPFGQGYVLWFCESMIGQPNGDGQIWNPIAPTLPSGTVGIPYNQTVTACNVKGQIFILPNGVVAGTGTVYPGYGTAIATLLPPGFTATILPNNEAAPIASNCQNILISGTTTVSGNYRVSAVINDDICNNFDPLGNCIGYYNKNTSQATYLFTINPVNELPPMIVSHLFTGVGFGGAGTIDTISGITVGQDVNYSFITNEQADFSPNPPSNLACTIDWGDGSTSPANMVFPGGNQGASALLAEVLGQVNNGNGTHSYTAPGTYLAHIVCDDDLAPTNRFIGSHAESTTRIIVAAPLDVFLDVTSSAPVASSMNPFNLTINGDTTVTLSAPQSSWNTSSGPLVLATPAVKIIVHGVNSTTGHFSFYGANNALINEIDANMVSASFGDVAEFPYDIHNFFYGFAKFVEPKFTPPDTEAPVITNVQFTPQTVYVTPFTISGTVIDTGSGVKSFTINGNAVTLGADGSYSISAPLIAGLNTFTEIAKDKEGNTATKIKEITYIPDQDHDGVLDPKDNCVTTPNPTQADIDKDGQGDECEPFSFAKGGVFVVGNVTPHAIGNKDYFWGAQWWKKNTLSTAGTVPAFKGYENTVNPPTCGDMWSTNPGNSSKPPAPTLPEYMAVVVSSKISKKGSVISGDTKEIVIVYTKGSGYDANPGHDATGTVVRTLCKVQ